MRVNPFLFVVPLATVVALAGCTQPAPAVQPTIAPSTTVPSDGQPRVTLTAPITPPPPQGDVGLFNDGDVPESTADPIEPLHALTAESVAAGFMTAFTQRELPAADWFAGIKPFLTDYAQTAYKLSSPAALPPVILTGTSTLQDGATTLNAVVDVDSDVGIFAVSLLRSTPDEVWLVSQVAMPAGIH